MRIYFRLNPVTFVLFLTFAISFPSLYAQGGGKEMDWLTSGTKAQWIWNAEGGVEKVIRFRKTFEISGKVKAARLYTTCDNQAELWVNGKMIGKSPDWPQPIYHKDASEWIQSGGNVIAIQGKNAGGVAALVFKLEVDLESGEKLEIVSRPDWKATREAVKEDWKKEGFDDSAWNLPLKSLGDLGVSPWRIPGVSKKGKPTSSAIDPEGITAAEGFKVELLYTVPREEQGSWVSLTKDPKGRFYASDQGGKGLFRLTVSGEKVDVEAVPLNGLSGAQGLEWAFGGLYFHRNGGNLYKLTDSDGDEILDNAEELPSEKGGGEHGNHGVTLTPDGKELFVDAGNHAALPPENSIVRKRVQSWDEDHLLPRQWDARGHARGRLAPGGWVSRFDPEKKTHDIISMGYRNQYDIALNSKGDLFTYDADMEWDLGMPWYRPTRICFVASGSDYGWRSGTGKWPTYYEDSLPPVVEIGPGSPTGVVTGVGTKFPAKYQEAIFALDWTFGTIYAIHLKAEGAGYTGEAEPWVYGSPLPVTDAEIGDDGNLYFLIGGRNTQSALYRVSYVGEGGLSPAEPSTPTPLAEIRSELEIYHGVDHSDAIEKAWPHLSSEDRFLRNAARVAIESQPVEGWFEKVISEADPQARVTGAVALARMGEPSHRGALLTALLDLDVKKLSGPQLLGMLRAYALASIRLGAPNQAERKKIIAQLNPLLPNSDPDVNTEVIRVLTYLEAPGVVEKAMSLITNRGETDVPDWTELASRNPGYGKTVLGVLENHPPTREINYAFMLRNARKGWTVDLRRQYFEFLNEVSKFSGGASFAGFLTNMRAEALGNCTNEERAALADVTGEDFNPKPDFDITPAQGPGRAWTIEEALSETNRRQKGRNFEAGRNLFHAAACAACHRIGGLGGDIGPDLTSVKNKFDRNYLIESIIDPGKTISDQYSSSTVTLMNGETLTGLIVERGEDFDVYPIDPKAEPIRVSGSDVEKVEQASVSQMPPGLINTLNPEELADLIAYLMSAGDPEDKAFLP